MDLYERISKFSVKIQMLTIKKVAVIRCGLAWIECCQWLGAHATLSAPNVAAAILAGLG